MGKFSQNPALQPMRLQAVAAIICFGNIGATKRY